MHPLSIFPELLNFPLVGYFLLRVTAGLFILYLGWERSKKPYDWTIILSLISLVLGALVILGLYTQISAILGILLIKANFWLNKKGVPISRDRIMLYVAVVVMLLSLLVTGPGLWAFDLPL